MPHHLTKAFQVAFQVVLANSFFKAEATFRPLCQPIQRTYMEALLKKGASGIQQPVLSCNHALHGGTATSSSAMHQVKPLNAACEGIWPGTAMHP